LDENLAKLKRSFEEATDDKLRCEQQAESTAVTISLANRYSLLVSAVGGRHAVESNLY
jgi:hypothetical protein